MNTSPTQRCILKLMVLLGVLSLSHAFQNSATGGELAHASRTLGKLNAWTMPTPTASSWYNEYNPAPHRTVYDDTPMEFTFVTMGNDWPTTTDSPAEDSTKEIRNPIRRAAQWARKVSRRP